MTAPPPSRQDLMTKRMTLVSSISALNAEALKLIQRLGALEMETMRIERDMAHEGTGDELVRALHEVEKEADALRAAQAECEERIAAAEQDIDATDRLLRAAIDR
jgi:hypothetical protein